MIFVNYLNDNYKADFMHKDYAENFRIFMYMIVKQNPKFFANVFHEFIKLINWARYSFQIAVGY